VERSLRGNEFRVVLTSNGIEGLKAARRRRPDLAILDIIMPGMDGYAVCREMRSDPLLHEVPILFLTAKIKDEDKIAGFMSGGDDYLCKPFNVDELMLRIRAILRRSNNPLNGHEAVELPPPAKATPPVKKSATSHKSSRKGDGRDSAVDMSAPPSRHRLIVGEYVLDTRSYELSTPARGKIRLTPVQFDLLQHLMRHPGEIFSPSRLLDEVWDYPSDTGSPDLVRVHIKNLRERIEADPRLPVFIRTVPGYGYTVSPDKD
jgi:DNA-binding response OmpR family regulator